MRRLHVSLGHNASAVLTENGKVVRGYEQERLDRRKGSSLFPLMAINAALGEEPADEIVLSHWIDNFDPLRTRNKHYNADVITRMFSHGRIWSVKAGEISHHDAHALSAHRFYDAHIGTPSLEGTTTIVVDGFGLGQECISMYRDGKLKHRTHGYRHSLGLMYQYTTGFLGLKENEDEFKLLGYEAQAQNYIGSGFARALRENALEQGRSFMWHTLKDFTADSPPVWIDRSDAEINLEALGKAKTHWLGVAQAWADKVPTTSQDARRTVVALQCQAFLEGAMEELVHKLAGDREDLLLAGGVFYNVKLNNFLLNSRSGRICVTPLAGDQGAALGISGVPYCGLTWGDRVLSLDGNAVDVVSNPSFFGLNEEEWPKIASRLLLSGGIVNVVRGRAEFGPRALCNTTTFALPTLDSVKAINFLNDRNDVMPMAPVMTRAAAEKAFYASEFNRVIGSDHYMVMTYEIKSENFPLGVTHPDPVNPERRTARPQVVVPGTDPSLEELLRLVEPSCLINTSYNFHGEPIVHSLRDAVKTHQTQCGRARAAGMALPFLIVVQS